MYPGWWDEGGTGRVLYRVLPSMLPGPHIELNLAVRPYPRPYEGVYPGFDEVS